MPATLTCKQGHRWSPVRLAGIPMSLDLCPTCGEPPLSDDVLEVLPVAEECIPVAGADEPETWCWAGVKLGPSLPMSVFTCTDRWNAERIGAMAMYCSDGRWGEACDEFCQRSLLIPRYDRWAVPGGPAWLVSRAGRRDYGPAAREQLDLLVRIHQLERIVLITHYGCAAYAELLHQDADACLPVQMEETRTAAATLPEWFPRLDVEAYLAMRQDNSLSFHRLDG